jgi:hypothetical protein
MLRSVGMWRILILLFVLPSLSGCTNGAAPVNQIFDGATPVPSIERQTTSPTATTDDSSATPTPYLADYTFPDQIDPNGQFLFYLHGKIIEDQGIPAISPEYGAYQYEDILKALQSYGFIVISEQRSKDVNAFVYIQKVVEQVNDLIKAGVPPGSITVVGASKGGVLAINVSDLVGNKEVNYVLLAACNPSTVDELSQLGVTLYGNVLSIYDSADTEASSCEDLFAHSEGIGLGQHKEIVLEAGTGHGIIYKPLEEWLDPTVRWGMEAKAPSVGP